MPAKTFGFQWHLTDRCNLRCAHCYQEGYTSAGEQDTGALKTMADSIFAAVPDRRMSINLTGGEPLLLPGLFDLIGHLHAHESLDEVNIITNGTMVSDEAVDRIGGFPKVSALKVSLESADPAANDRIRGPGVFSTVQRNIEKLRRTGKQIVLMMTLGRFNLEGLEETVLWARETGLDGVIFERFVPLGRGKTISDQVLGPGEWEAVSRAAGRAAGIDEGPEGLLPYRAFWLSVEDCADPLRGAPCNLGDESMALMPGGDVYPCRRLPIALGNLLRDPFDGILRKLRAYAPSRMKPRLTGGVCAGCPVEECAGCRAAALALTGDVLADDPQCPSRTGHRARM